MNRFLSECATLLHSEVGIDPERFAEMRRDMTEKSTSAFFEYWCRNESAPASIQSDIEAIRRLEAEPGIADTPLEMLRRIAGDYSHS